MSSTKRERYVLAAIGVVALLTFLYAVLIVHRPLAWVSITASLLLLYLVWRFVRAVERIADALES